jgi:hypothetical protein
MNRIEFLDQAAALFPDARRVPLTANTESEAASCRSVDGDIVSIFIPGEE